MKTLLECDYDTAPACPECGKVLMTLSLDLFGNGYTEIGYFCLTDKRFFIGCKDCRDRAPDYPKCIACNAKELVPMYENDKIIGYKILCQYSMDSTDVPEQLLEFMKELTDDDEHSPTE